MANQKVRSDTLKIVRKPATVKYKTKSGKTVFFKAVKIEQKRVASHFRAKKK
jgi:hypothetical protein